MDQENVSDGSSWTQTVVAMCEFEPVLSDAQAERVWLEKRIEGFQQACEEGEKILRDRGAAYGDATAECGFVGAAITLTTDVARIRRIVMDLGNLQRISEGDEELLEKLEDALIDAHNYAAIAYYWLKQGNLMGRPIYS